MGRPAIRLLPVTIAATAGLLAVKCVDLAHKLAPQLLLAESMVPAAQAASSEPSPAPAVASPAMPAAAQAAPAAAPAPQPPSAAELQLLQDLRARREQLDQRERALDERQGVLDAAEKRLNSRVAELSALQTRLEALEADRHAHEEANWAGIVKVYETMKPREAAAIFNDMDMPVLLQVMDRMQDSKAAVVLGLMQPDRARLLTAQLAAMRTRAITVPPAQPAGGG